MSGYDTEQLFNCDETGLQFRLLPHKTLAHAFEKRAKGRNKSENRVTISVCANVTRTTKLPLLLVRSMTTDDRATSDRRLIIPLL